MEAITIDQNSISKIIEDWEYLINKNCNFDHRLDWLAGNAAIMVGQTIEIGDPCYQFLQQDSLPSGSKKASPYHLVTYHWVEQVKMLLILTRDSLFEQYKAMIFHQDGSISKKQLEELWQRTQQLLQKAVNNIKTTNQFPNTSRSSQLLKQWKHQKNPWPVYKKQLLLIIEQIQLLVEGYQTLLTIQKVFEAIGLLINDTIQNCLNDLKNNSEKIDQVIELIIAPNKKSSHNLSAIHEVSNQLKLIPHFSLFKEALENLLAPYDITFSPIINVKGGILERRDFLPYKNTIQWFESEIDPLLHEVWEMTDQGTSGLRMILLNMTNRLDIIQQERPQELFNNQTTLIKPLQTFQKDLTSLVENTISLTNLIHKRVETELRLSALFDSKTHFLAVSFQSTLNQKIWNNKSGWLAQAQHWIAVIMGKLNQLHSKIYQEQSLSISEKIVICIKSRQIDPANKHYANIFLTKGYVGESFIIGRTPEINRFKNLVDNWKEGFRGSVMLIGDRFSGKTVFAEIVARKFFHNNFYSLRPKNSLTIDGRKMQTSYDLKEALDFFCKHSINKKPMIWIDDLELWWSKNIPFYQNIQHLMNCIDAYSNRIFFVIATNTKARHKIANFSHAKRIFQAEINLNQLSKEYIQQAIYIRHGATQKKIVDQNRDELTIKAFNKLIHKIYKTARGNIGEALLHWANSTYYVDENTVEHRLEAYKSLPSFLNEDSSLILELLLSYKRANEYLLRHLLGGKAFEMRYATVIRRLINVGILERQLDGYIEIEATIVNDLKQMLA